MLFNNFLFTADSYKLSHFKQYPPKTETVYSYFESRGGKFPNIVFFGLQYLLKKLEGQVLTHEDITEAAPILKSHFFDQNLLNVDGFRNLVLKHQGRLPVVIKALPEGTVAPVRTALFTVENTDPEFYWLTNFLETYLSQVWYPSSVCTLSYHTRKLIEQYMMETGGSTEGVEFKLHDFGFRGVSSLESAAIGGMAHLVNFAGTDTLAGLACAMETYEAPVCGFSIPATEHSTITSWGREHESDAYENILKQYPEGYVAVVSDSYNIYKACKDIWGDKLKDQVLARNGVLVVRPDSGRPEDVVVRCLNILGEAFGYERTPQGYKVLNPKIRIIQGDGVDYDKIEVILQEMKRDMWAATNLAFGQGGALLQKLNRDTHKFAFKCSAVKVNGEWRDVYKDPITDQGKTSKKGRMSVVEEHGKLITVPEISSGEDKLVEVFRDGEITKTYSWEEIKTRT